jgi:hypothetical protein
MGAEHWGMGDDEQQSAQRKTSPNALTGALEMKSCKNAPISFAMSVSPNNSRTAKRIFMKFDTGEFY